MAGDQHEDDEYWPVDQGLTAYDDLLGFLNEARQYMKPVTVVYMRPDTARQCGFSEEYIREHTVSWNEVLVDAKDIT